MRKIEIHRTIYKCDICKTEYDNETDCKKCERRILEQDPFKVGDKVQSIEPRQCSYNGRNYFFKGRITKVVGPMPSDEEYERKWLGQKPERLNGHVYAYQVEFTCPFCHGNNAKMVAEYYGPELKLV